MTSETGHLHEQLGVVTTGPVNGRRVVLVHGALDRSSGMARLARALSTTAHVTRYDRRGYGRAVDHPGPFTVAANAEDLLALLDDGPAVLVGHSLGAHVVLTAAAMRPAIALGVAIYEPPLSWEPWWGSGRRERPTDPAEAAEDFMRRMVGNRVWERLPEATRAARRAEGRAFVAEGSDLRRGRPWDPEAITCEVRIGYGSRTAPQFVRAAEELAVLLRADSVVIPDASHGAHLTSSTELADLLVRPLRAFGTTDGDLRSLP